MSALQHSPTATDRQDPGTRRQRPDAASGRYRALCLFLAAVLVCACAAPQTQRDPDLPNRTFSTITIVSPRDLIDVNTPGTRGSRALEGATAGSAGAGLGGALLGAAACGPYLYGICVVGLAGAGLIAGSAAGALYGFTGIPGPAADQLRAGVETINRSRDLQADLAAQLRRRLPEEMLAEPDRADVQAIVLIQSIEFIGENDGILMQLTVRLSYATDRSQRRPSEGHRDFHARSAAADLSAWLAHDSPLTRQAISVTFEQAAGEIAALLLEHRVAPGPVSPAAPDPRPE